MQKLYYATGNSDKYESVYRYLEKNASAIDLQPCTHDFLEIQSYDQKAIAVDKGRQAWEYLQEPVLVDDAGVYFEKYNNFPGVMTKYVYHGLKMDGLLKLVEEGDRAVFRLHLVYYYGPDQYEVFKGECSGTIRYQTQFPVSEQTPYNVLFVPEGSDKTYAELIHTGEHQKFDYRIDALKKFLHWYTLQK